MESIHGIVDGRRPRQVLPLFVLVLATALSSTVALPQSDGGASAPTVPASPASGIASTPTTGTVPANTAQSTTTQTLPLAPDAAARAGLFATLDPPSAPIGAQDNSAVFVLRLRNTTNKAMKLRIELSPLAAKAGDAWALATLTTQQERSFASIVLPADSDLPFPIQVKGVTRSGQFDGQIRVTTEPASDVQLTKAIQVIRQTPGFAPTYKGEDISGDVFTLKATSADHKLFSFLVSNPLGEADVTVEVASTLSGAASAPILTVKPSSFKLTPGSEQSVQIELDAPPERGPMRGQLRLTDSRSGVIKSLGLKYEPMFLPEWATLKLVCLVLAGALISVLVGSIIPTLVKRNMLWERLRRLSAAIELLAKWEPRACAALQQRAYGIDQLSRDAVFLSPRAEGVLNESTKRADELQVRLDLVQAVAEARADALTTSPVPASLLVPLSRNFDKIAEEAASRDPALAKTKLDATLAALTTDTSAAAIYSSLQARGPLQPPVGYGFGSQEMRDRLDRLHADIATISAAMPLNELVRINREVWCADLYFVQYLQRLTNEKGDESNEQLTKLLSSGNLGLLSAAAIVLSMQRGVTPAMVTLALEDLPKNATLQVRPSTLRVGDLAHCEVVFNDTLLAQSPLLDTARLKWHFGDGTSDGYGLRVTHVFQRDWWAALLNRDKSVDKSLRKGTAVNVTVSSPNGSELEDKVRVLELSGWSEVVNNSEVFIFFVALLLACGLALLTKDAQSLRFDAMVDYINPLIWGFGADQAKALVNKRPAGS